MNSRVESQFNSGTVPREREVAAIPQRHQFTKFSSYITERGETIRRAAYDGLVRGGGGVSRTAYGRGAGDP